MMAPAVPDEIVDQFVYERPWVEGLMMARTFVPPRVTLLRHASSMPACYLIASGRATVRSSGKQIATLGRGDFVTTVPLPGRPPIDGTVVAETPMELIVLSAREMQRMVDRVPDVATRIVEGIAHRVREGH